MSAATAAPGVTGRTSSFVLSPVLLVMLALSAWGAWGIYRGETVPILGVGPTVAIGAAVIWLVYGAVAIGAIVLLQRYARRPAWTIAVALCWGGLAATYVAGIANGAMSTLFQNVLGSDSSIWVSGPFVEESIKAVGVIGLALVPVLRRFGPIDGLFYGVVVGAAFQVVENYLYSLTAAFQSGGSPWQAIWTNAFLRGVIGVFSHAVWAAAPNARGRQCAAGVLPGAIRSDATCRHVL